MKTDHENRKRYTWYLHAPFKGKFDCTHWWKSRSNTDRSRIDRVAALYELVRRHPRIGDALFAQSEPSTENLKKLQEACLHLPEAGQMPALAAAIKQTAQRLREPAALTCLRFYGLRSWPKLSALEQECWKAMAGKIKGVDCRLDTNRLRSIDGEAFFFRHEISAFGRVAKRLTDKSATVDSEVVRRLVDEEIKRDPHPLTRQDEELEIAKRATLAHRDGLLLFAVAPDLSQDEAKRLFLQELRKQQVRLGIRPMKPAQSRHWLSLIERFEATGTAIGERSKSDLFKEFRKAVDLIGF